MYKILIQKANVILQIKNGDLYGIVFSFIEVVILKKYFVINIKVDINKFKIILSIHNYYVLSLKQICIPNI